MFRVGLSVERLGRRRLGSAQNRVFFLAGGYIDMPAAGAGSDPACRFVGVPWVWLICIPAGNSWLRRRGGLSVEESPKNAVFACVLLFF